MDLVNWEQSKFEIVKDQIENTLDAEKIHLSSHYFVPISALKGDNLIENSENMPWYSEPPLWELLKSWTPFINNECNRLRVLLGNTREVFMHGNHTKCVFAIVESGILNISDIGLTIYPQNIRAKLKTIMFADNESETDRSEQGDQVYLIFDGFSEAMLQSLEGSIIALDSEPPQVGDVIHAVLDVQSKSGINTDRSLVLFLNNKAFFCKNIKINEVIASGNEEYVPGSTFIPSDTSVDVDIKIGTKTAFENYESNKESSLCRFFIKEDKEIVAMGVIKARYHNEQEYES
jgi:translation elongation factor EF-1alpha